MKKSVAGLTFSIIAAVVYLIGLFMLLTSVEDRGSGYGGIQGPLLAISALSAASAILAIVGIVLGVKGKKEQNSLSGVAITVSIFVAIAGAATSIILTAMSW